MKETWAEVRREGFVWLSSKVVVGGKSQPSLLSGAHRAAP